MLSIYLSMVDTDEKRNLLEKIYVKHRDRMFAVAMRYLHNRSDAEDAVHEAFLRIAEGKTKIFEISPNKIVAYTDIIIRNITVDMLKKRKSLGKLEKYGDGNVFINAEGYLLPDKNILVMTNIEDNCYDVFLLKVVK